MFRLYDLGSDTYLYTADPAERDALIASSGFRDDGFAFNACADLASGAIPMYRFSNVRKGTHVCTTDEAERDRLETRYGGAYSYEGVVGHVLPADGSDRIPVYGFYAKRSRTSYYTTDVAERDLFLQSMGRGYEYQGICFYAFQ